MYIPDGSNLEYISEIKRINFYSWGWIGNSIPNNPKIDNNTKSFILNKIKNIPKKYLVNLCCGNHACEICGKDDFYFNGEIRIAYKNKLYVCPAGFHHYIEFHNYHPPKEVIRALYKGDLLNEESSQKYNKNDEHFQNSIKKRHEECIKEEREGAKRDREERRQRKQQAQKRIQKIKSGSEFEKAIKQAFIIDSPFNIFSFQYSPYKDKNSPKNH